MTTAEEIQQSRAQLEFEKEALTQALEKYKPALRRIKSKDPTPLERRQLKEIRRKALVQFSPIQQDILSSEKAFETQVAQYEPSLAKQKYSEEVYNKAAVDVNNQELQRQQELQAQSLNQHYHHFQDQNKQFPL